MTTSPFTGLPLTEEPAQPPHAPCATTHRHLHLKLIRRGSERLWDGVLYTESGTTAYTEPDLMTVVGRACLHMHLEDLVLVYGPIFSCALSAWKTARTPSQKRNAAAFWATMVGDMSIVGLTVAEIKYLSGEVGDQVEAWVNGGGDFLLGCE